MKVEVPKPAQEQTTKNENLRENFPSDLEISLRISIFWFFGSCAGFAFLCNMGIGTYMYVIYIYTYTHNICMHITYVYIYICICMYLCRYMCILRLQYLYIYIWSPPPPQGPPLT